MKMSEKGLLFLMELEAVVLAPYKDSKGIWTIGVGHTAMAGPPDPATASPLSFDGAMALFRRDLEKYEARVSTYIPRKLKQHQFDALVSWHFNTGAVAKATLTKRVNVGDMEGAAAQFLLWRKPPEILGRRRAEYKLFTTGNYQEPFLVQVYKKKPGNFIVVNVKE